MAIGSRFEILRMTQAALQFTSPMLVLGIETSCDETSVAVITDRGEVLSNLIASQIDRHQPFGGVVPEVASREHLIHFAPVLEESLRKAEIGLPDIGAIAVTSRPGLIGALLVGVAAAQGLSYGLGIPIVGVNHLEGHIFSPYLQRTGESILLPQRFLSLVVSGGHSSIYDVYGGADPKIEMLNRTRDDAAGEVFDKVAKFIGLPYPGGPHVERVARTGDPTRFPFPLARFKIESTDFSFSGLKAMAIRTAREAPLITPPGQDVDEGRLSDFCAGFQLAVVDQIEDRLTRIWSQMTSAPDPLPTELALGGGVAANTSLRERVAKWSAERNLTVRLPERIYCTDNGAMIAFAGLGRLRAGERDDPRRLIAQSRA